MHSELIGTTSPMTMDFKMIFVNFSSPYKIDSFIHLKVRAINNKQAANNNFPYRLIIESAYACPNPVEMPMYIVWPKIFSSEKS